MHIAVPFDTLAFVRKLEASGIPTAQAEAQAEALSDAFQKVEAYRMRELATQGDLETAKVDRIKWVVTTGIVILGGVAALIRFVPSVPAYGLPPAQELRQTAPAPQMQDPPVPNAPTSR